MMKGAILTVLTVLMVSGGWAPPGHTPRAPDGSQGGPVEVGAAVTFGVFVLNQVKEAVQNLGKATAYAKVKSTGPDGDDDKVAFDWDTDRGLDWSLDAFAGFLRASNDVDDGHEDPYDRGTPHSGFMEIHFDSDDGQWGPDPSDCIISDCKTAGQGAYGNVIANPDDDPTAKDQETKVGAAAAFSADGKTFDFCYRVATSTTPGGAGTFDEAEKVDCSPARELSVTQRVAFLVSAGRFEFAPVEADSVEILPLFARTRDLLHVYLQEEKDRSVFPILRGYDELVQELKAEFYDRRVQGTRWDVVTEEGERADLTVLGAALRFESLRVARGGRTELELLEEYFSSGAVSVIAPEHAQAGYGPEVAFRQIVKSGADLFEMTGREVSLPANKDPSASTEEDPLVGVAIEIRGSMEEAVNRALDTRGHFVRSLAERAAQDAGAGSGGDGEIRIRIPSLNFHAEQGTFLSDIAVASPREPAKTTPRPPSVEDLAGSDWTVYPPGEVYSDTLPESTERHF